MQAATKHPHLMWILPNAIEGHCWWSQWFIPHRLSPTALSSSKQEEEDEEGLQECVRYMESLIDEQVARGIPASRIILGGFSQGHCVALLTSLVSPKYAGKVAGVVGMSGYLPMASKIDKLRKAAGLPAKMEQDNMAVFLTRGMRDYIVPERYMSITSQALLDAGIKPENVTVKEYEALGHAIRGDELDHFGQWLEKVVPRLE